MSTPTIFNVASMNCSSGLKSSDHSSPSHRTVMPLCIEIKCRALYKASTSRVSRSASRTQSVAFTIKAPCSELFSRCIAAQAKASAAIRFLVGMTARRCLPCGLSSVAPGSIQLSVRLQTVGPCVSLCPPARLARLCGARFAVLRGMHRRFPEGGERRKTAKRSSARPKAVVEVRPFERGFGTARPRRTCQPSKSVPLPTTGRSCSSPVTTEPGPPEYLNTRDLGRTAHMEVPPGRWAS